MKGVSTFHRYKPHKGLDSPTANSTRDSSPLSTMGGIVMPLEFRKMAWDALDPVTLCHILFGFVSTLSCRCYS